MKYILSEIVADGIVEVRRVNDSVILPPHRTWYATEALALEAARKYNFMHLLERACGYLEAAHSDTVCDCISFAEGELATLPSLPRYRGPDGLNEHGTGRDTYDCDGYDGEGVDRNGFDRQGYDRSGLLRPRKGQTSK